ncbi:MAG: alpha/beta hydrolase [Candidatus Nanopelagicales bacterium]|nr:alpha/beta hydrolase [Candidatus Nanopelagicales bacterium]
MSPSVQKAAVNGIEIAYQTFGEPTNPPMLLIMGLGTQMIAWPEEFCNDLADHGLFVIRFDNRDVGESTHINGEPAPGLADLLLKRKPLAYRIEDMADDATGLMDALGLQSAHIVGASLGGFIAQTIALRAPKRVRSLSLIMTSTGSRRVGQAKPKLLLRMLKRRDVADRHAAIAATIDTFRLIGSQGYAFDEERLSEIAGQSYDRGYNPDGYLRQLAAATHQPNRTKALAAVEAPTLVMHGLGDPLIAVSGGVALARAIPGARFVGFNGMGHDLPRALWPEFTAEILELANPTDQS